MKPTSGACTTARARAAVTRCSSVTHRAIFVATASAFALGCGGGVPVRLEVDQTTVDLDLSVLADPLRNFLQLPAGATLPDEIPPALQEVLGDAVFEEEYATAPVVVDLSPEEGDPSFEDYQQINDVEKAIRRVEINALVVRAESSDISTFPASRLTLMAAPNGDGSITLADRFAIGSLPTSGLSGETSIPFTYFPGGESFLSQELSDRNKDLTLQLVGSIRYDPSEDPVVPKGRATLRLILTATFFVEVERVIF